MQFSPLQASPREGPCSAGAGSRGGQGPRGAVLRDLGADVLRGGRGLRERHPGGAVRAQAAALLDDQPQEGPHAHTPGIYVIHIRADCLDIL